MGANARTVVVAALVIATLAVVIITTGGGDEDQEFSAVVPAAANLVDGQEITAAGEQVGKVTDVDPVDRGRAARITMQITDDDYWPLARDTKMAIRFGGTVSFSNRYLTIKRGKDTAHPIAEDGELPRGAVHVPVEVDEFIQTFNGSMRRGIRSVINESAEVWESSSKDLGRALKSTGPVTENLAGVFQDLKQNRAALETLVSSSGRVVDAVQRSNPDIGVLIQGLSDTFGAIAAESDDLKTTLDRAPGALRQTRTTLSNADVTLREAGDLTDELRPGIRRLKQTVRPLRTVLRHVRAITPLARDTLQSAPGAERLARLVDQVEFISKDVAHLGPTLAHEIGCVRPWAPELTTLGVSWGDWLSYVDEKDHYLHAVVQNFLPAFGNAMTYGPADAAKQFKGMDYGFPRPPGHLAAQPWFQPQCGVGPDQVDPSKDKEHQYYLANRPPVPNELRPPGQALVKRLGR